MLDEEPDRHRVIAQEVVVEVRPRRHQEGLAAGTRRCFEQERHQPPRRLRQLVVGLAHGFPAYTGNSVAAAAFERTSPNASRSTSRRRWSTNANDGVPWISANRIRASTWYREPPSNTGTPIRNERGITVEPVSVSVLLTRMLLPLVTSTLRSNVPLERTTRSRAIWSMSTGLGNPSPPIRSSSLASRKSANASWCIALPSAAVHASHSGDRGHVYTARKSRQPVVMSSAPSGCSLYTAVSCIASTSAQIRVAADL